MILGKRKRMGLFASTLAAALATMTLGAEQASYAGEPKATVQFHLLDVPSGELVPALVCIRNLEKLGRTFCWLAVFKSVAKNDRDVVEYVVGFVSHLLNRRQADDHDEGQHYSIFNCGGTIFRDQKVSDSLSEVLHRFSLSVSEFLPRTTRLIVDAKHQLKFAARQALVKQQQFGTTNNSVTTLVMRRS